MPRGTHTQFDTTTVYPRRALPLFNCTRTLPGLLPPLKTWFCSSDFKEPKFRFHQVWFHSAVLPISSLSVFVSSTPVTSNYTPSAASRQPADFFLGMLPGTRVCDTSIYLFVLRNTPPLSGRGPPAGWDSSIHFLLADSQPSTGRLFLALLPFFHVVCDMTITYITIKLLLFYIGFRASFVRTRSPRRLGVMQSLLPTRRSLKYIGKRWNNRQLPQTLPGTICYNSTSTAATLPVLESTIVLLLLCTAV